MTIFGESAGGISVSMLAASPAAKGLFQRAISESGGNFAPPRFANEGGVSGPPLRSRKRSGQGFLGKLGASDIKAARALPAEKLQAALGPGLQRGFWPVFDGDVLPGDRTAILTGEALQRHADPDRHQLRRRRAVRSAGSDAGAVRSVGSRRVRRVRRRDPCRLSARDRLRKPPKRAGTSSAIRHSRGTRGLGAAAAQKGTGKAYVYYFDHRTPQSPNGASHAAEIGYVFRNAPDVAAPLGPPGPPGPRTWRCPDLVSSYCVNFAKTGDPNGPGLPAWPAFTVTSQNAMHFDTKSSARPVPNMTQIKALDDYFAWRREEAKSTKIRVGATQILVGAS